MTAAQRQADRRRRLLEAALDGFAKEGYSRCSVERVCQLAQVSTRDCYAEFPNREALLAAVYEQIIAETAGGVVDALDAAPSDLRAQARAALGAFVEVFVLDERKARINFIEAIGVSPEFERRRRAVLNAFRDLIAARAEPLVGVPADQLSVTAMALVGATQEALVDWVLGDRRGEAAGLVEELSEIYEAALSRRRSS